MHDNCNLLRNIKQEPVTYHLTMPLTYIYMMHRGEVIRMLPLNGQASRIKRFFRIPSRTSAQTYARKYYKSTVTSVTRSF